MECKYVGSLLAEAPFQGNMRVVIFFFVVLKVVLALASAVAV